nr:disease resistance protein tao1 [Quercus suber]
MESLVTLEISNCSNRKAIPKFVANPKFLQELFLDRIAIVELIKNLPENLWIIKGLEILDLSKVDIEELPSSIERLTELTSLTLRYCENLVSLPNTICSLKLLKSLDLFGCLKFFKSAYLIAMEMKEAEQEGTSGNASQSRLWKTIWSVWESYNLLVDCHWNFADVVWRLGCDVGSSAISLAQFMAIAWNIWRNRNGIRHGEERKKKENLILEASRFISEFQVVQDPPIPSVCSFQTSWLPPEPGVYKANVDGAVFKNG